MLASRWPGPFIDPAWGFEIKWDGVRLLVHHEADRGRLWSRAGNDATASYPELAALDLGRPLVLDGEVVAFDHTGRPSFEQLQQRMNARAPAQVAALRTRIPISYVVFDVLYDDGPLIDLPWSERRERLAALELPEPVVRSTPVDEDPSALWAFVRARGIEGIVGKRRASPYRPGVRSPDWRKVTDFRTVRVVIGGYTQGEAGRTGTFGALVLGLWTDEGLRFVGSVGSGFKDAELVAVRGALDEMTIDRPPFVPSPDLPPRAVWVEPHLVAMVQFKEWTGVGRLRAPSFKGFTADPHEAVTWEAEGPAAPG